MKKNLTLFVLIFSFSAMAGEYIVCKDIGRGKIKCEDGIWGKTAEVGFIIDASKLRLNELSQNLDNSNKPQRKCSNSVGTGEFDTKGHIICGNESIPKGEVQQMTENNGGNVTGKKITKNKKPIQKGEVQQMTENNGGNVTGKKIIKFRH